MNTTNNNNAPEGDDHESPAGSNPILRGLTPAQQEALRHIRFTGENIAGKPVVELPMRVLNLKSAFAEKFLCTGITMTAGSACAFSCPYCYVDPLLSRQPAMIAIKAILGLAHEKIVVRRAHALESLRRELRTPRRHELKAICRTPQVVYCSPTVDCAANMVLARETLAMCLEILNHTVWEIRLLSKSPLLAWIADQIPEAHRLRMIYGLSIGTLDNNLGQYETGTPLVTHRLRALHHIQDRGLRTYGMICPIVPQANYVTYATEMVEALRIERCEHVWAEVINARGSSMRKTCRRLSQRGFDWESTMLQRICTNPDVWEAQARAAFMAMKAVVPPEKLRFLQYVNPRHLAWWNRETAHGAVLLGAGAHDAQAA